MTNTLLRPVMSNYRLGVISCLCLLLTGLCAESCSPAVLARRHTFYVPAGGSLSLSCVVQHCGGNWKGHWMRGNSTDPVKESVRHRLTNVTLSVNLTQLTLDFLSVSQLDEGSYGYMLTWRQGSAQGNLMHVKVTAAERSVWHRVLVCAGACLCLPIILGLARCLSSEVKPQPLPRTRSTYAAAYRDEPHPAPQPPPRCPVPQKSTPVPTKRSTPSHRALPKSQQKTEVVYADISQDVLRQQGATREPAQSTVYSSLNFQPGIKAERS